MAKDEKQKKQKHFFKDFKAELKKVIWPTPKQVVNSTIAVITIVIITAAIVFALDLAFDLFNNYGINKFKERIQNTEDNTVTGENETDNNGIDEDADSNNETDGNDESSGENEQ